MLQAYSEPPTLIDDVDMTLSEAWLDTVTTNTMVLDSLSFRAPAVCSSSAGKDTSTPNAYTGQATEVIWRGSFQMQSGMTTLTIEGWAQKGASESFQLFVNGAGISTTAVPNGAAFSLTATISALTIASVAEVVIQISGARTAAQALAAKYVIYDAYVSPAPSIASSWPGVPTFAGTYSATLCNQLANAQIYLAARLNALPMLPFLSSYYIHGSSVTGDVYPLWWGAVERANGSNILNIRIVPIIMANIAEYYRVKINGTIVHTGATMTVGETRDDYLSIDLSSFTASTRLEAVIETVITSGALAGPSGDRNSRYHLWTVRMSNSAPAVMAAPYDFTADESLASTSVDTKLNALSTALLAAYTRINGNPRIFNRVPLMRRMYGRNSEQWQTYSPNNAYVQRAVRQGSRLIVRGKNVKVMWGAYATKAEKTTTTAYSVDFAHSQQLTSGDAIETKTIYLDTLETLRRGQVLAIGGEDVTYAAEVLV